MLQINESLGPQDGRCGWVKANWPRAVVFARSRLRDRDAAEDVVQDCFCNLLCKADVYDLPRDGAALLMKSIVNACMKRNVRVRPTLSINATPADGLDPADAADAQPPRVVLHAELERAIATALAALPDVQRAAIELKGLGSTLQEIADILDVSPSNAGVLIHRGRQELARRLAPYLETEPDERTGKQSAE